MSGENQYRKPSLLKLKSLKLNGDEGVFYLTHLDEAKGEDGRYRKEKIEGTPEVVFLKIRRRLIEASSTGVVKQTTEHNHPDDVVKLFGENNLTDSGTARELREKYETLRTEQIVYCRYKGQIVRLSVKGASLGSEKKAKTTTDFYAYLKSFQGDDHWYETRTRLSVIKEGEARTYYCIDFQRGEALDEEQKAKVIENMTTVYENCKAFDDYYRKAPVVTQETELPTIAADDSGTSYPDDEINPDDIPF